MPGALVLVVGGLLATPLFNLDAHGVALVGEVPRGLPTPGLPDLDVFEQHYATILAAAAGLLLIGFSQTAGDARAFAARHRYRVDVDQESVAQGMANVAAGAFRGMPVSTSLSASSLNESAGARTPLASLVTGALVILTLVALAPLFSDLPKAVLGAIIIDAVVFGMIDIPELRRLRRVKRFDFWVAAAAIVAVLSAGVLAGVVIGIALSLVWLVYVATTPEMPLLGREPGTHVFRERASTRATRRSPASPWCAWTAACSSPPPRRSTSASARSRRTPTRRCAPCSWTWRAWTSSTPRARRRSRRSSTSPRAPASRLSLARVKPAVREGARRATASWSASARTASTAASPSPSRRSSPRIAA